MTAKKTPAERKAPKPASTKKSTVTSTVAKRRAREATRRAQQAGVKADGKRLAAAQQALRDSMIVARIRAGEDPKEVAKAAGVVQRTVQRVVAAARDMPSPLEETPMALVEELARDSRRAIADLEAMAFAWAGLNQSASLGAKKAAGEERARLATLLAEVGKLPSNLELFKSEMEMQRVGEEMANALLAVRDGTQSVDEAIELFLSFGRRQAQLAPGSPA